MRAGFSLMELLAAVVAAGILASMGLLRYGDSRSGAEAAAVADDIREVASAALRYQAMTGDWPPDAARGLVPTGLGPFLEEGVLSSQKRELEWDKFGVSVSGSGYIAGITLSSTDTRLLSRVINSIGAEYPYFVAGNLVTWVLPERGTLLSGDPG